MGGAQQPFMYSAVQRNDTRLPEVAFDPKAVTRASWEPKKFKPKPDGPLVSFNRHPDAHMVLSYRSNNYSSMSPRIKGWIKWLRILQLLLRILELVGAAGILVLVILMTKIETVTGWIMKITPAIVTANCLYAIYHLCRDSSGRPPASSSAYHLFSAMTDVSATPIYAFCALTVHNKADGWKTVLANQDLMHIFVPAVYYTFIGAGSLHLVSLSTSLWLGWMFRKISLMPPDMNPLEDNLTARPKHKKAKSSVTTLSTMDMDSRISTPRDSRRMSGLPYNGTERPPSVPFMHTRTGSSTTVESRGSRQYQIVPGSRDSIASQIPGSRGSIASRDTKRASATRSYRRDTYTEIPLNDPSSSRPPSSSNRNSQTRPAKFTETWVPTDSLISRTNQRNREMAASKTSAQNRGSKSYEALTERYYHGDSSDDEYGDENIQIHNDDDETLGGELRPHPLRLNPMETDRATPPRAKTPYFPLGNSLSEVSPNTRRVSASQDIADEKPAFALAKPSPRNRQSSIQTEESFYSRPYGELQSATPPVMVGNNRKVSSGNDFDSKYVSGAYGRRNVSGKVAEEGRGGVVGNRFSRFGRDEL
ncbi:hypothetical protein EDB81DRAFT_803969 [Dactylonectria macrodidyma]|uniref:Uncharacterized protein n=1 Tax=Dactylonectria macrodidyma TaxID=307937 RepID=A0A9P9IU39_9HYPO|nr:hypothetical protein EDB81DRAFT_803969 [Dactylonectria macrodidyma]